MLLVLPVMLTAADQGDRDVLRVGEAEFISETEFTVALEVIHDEDLAAMDIPLTFSEGVTLTDVTFEGTRVADFDEKIVNIYNESNRVNIGLINMVYALKENPALKPAAGGNRTVAVLHFTLDDTNLESLEIGQYQTENPHHQLMYVYQWFDGDVTRIGEISPLLENGAVSLASRTPGAALPASYELAQNVPNPFNPSTDIRFALPQAGKVNLSIYNVLGQHVKSLVDGYMDAGYQTVTWDGTDNRDNIVASGVYFYKLSAEGYTNTKKMLLLK
jgi:hypothetical protein